MPVELGCEYATTTHFTFFLTPVTREVTMVRIPVFYPVVVKVTTLGNATPMERETYEVPASTRSS